MYAQKQKKIITPAGKQPSTMNDFFRSQHLFDASLTDTNDIQSPGVPPGSEIDSSVVPQFGHNFGNVRVHAAVPETMQTKLSVSQPGDSYEQEAEGVAEQATDIGVSATGMSAGAYDERRGKLSLMAKVSAPKATEETSDVPPIVHEVLNNSGQPLDSSTQAFMEPRFGHDFSRIRIHADTSAANLAQEFNAQAFTLGQNIYFGSGSYQPGSERGKSLLAHELTHSIQQGNSIAPEELRVSKPGEPLEREADIAASQVMAEYPVAQDAISLAAPVTWSRIARLPADAGAPTIPATTPASTKQADTDTLAEQIVGRLLLDPTDSSGQIKNQFALLDPPTRQAVLEKVRARLSPEQWERLTQILGEPTALVGEVSPSVPAAPGTPETEMPSQSEEQPHTEQPAEVAAGSIAAGALVAETAPVPKTAPAADGTIAPAPETAPPPKATPEVVAAPMLATTATPATGATLTTTNIPAASTGTASPPSPAPLSASTSTAASAAEPMPTTAPAADIGPAPSVTPTASAAAVSTTTIEGATEEFTQFQQQAAEQQNVLLQSAEQKKQQILTTAEAEKRDVQQAIEAEADRVEGVCDQTIQQIQQGLENARTAILAQRDAKIEATRNATQGEIINLQQIVQDKQNAIKAVGEAKATAALGEGEEQARRAVSTSDQKAALALAIGEQKAQQYSSYKEASTIAGAARQMATEVAQNIRKAGNELVKIAFQAGSDLAAKFRREANEAAENFTKGQDTRQKKIQQQGDETNSRLNELAQETISHLETNASDSIAQIQTGRQGTAQQIRQLAQSALGGIDQSAEAACGQVDAATVQTTAQMNSFVADVGARLSESQGEKASQVLGAAQVQLSTAVAQHDAALNRFADDAGQAMQDQAVQMHQEVSDHLDQLAEIVRQSGTQFETASTNASDQVSQKMEETASQAAEGMHKIVTDTEKDLQNAIDQCQSRWEAELNQGKADIRERIDSGLAKHDEALANLGSKIDAKAQETTQQGTLSSIGGFFKNIGAFIGGVIVGILEAIVSMIEGIAILLVGLIKLLAEGNFLAWFLLVVVVALLAVIFFVGGWVAVGAFIGAILLAVGIVMAVMAIINGFKYLWAAITTPGLSWYERGKLVGKAIFEFVMAFLIILEFLKLAKIGDLGEGGEVAEIGQLSKVLEGIKNSLKDERAIEQFDTLFERMGRDSAKMEKAVKGMTGSEDLVQLSPEQLEQLEQKLIEQWNKAHPEPKQPHGDAIDQVPALKARVEALAQEIEAYKAANPNVQGVSGWLKDLNGEIEGLDEMLEGEKEATSVEVRDRQSHIDGLEAELRSAQQRTGVTSVGPRFPLDGMPKKVQVDVVADNGHTWVEVKNVKPFGLDSSNWLGSDRTQGLRLQAEELLRSAGQNPFDGVPPHVVIEFPKGVSQEVADALKGMGVDVQGSVVQPQPVGP